MSNRPQRFERAIRAGVTSLERLPVGPTLDERKEHLLRQAGNLLFNLKQRQPGSELSRNDLRSIAELSVDIDVAFSL